MSEAKDKAERELMDDDTRSIVPEINRSLNEVWKKTYTNPVHPPQEFRSRIFSSMYRALRIRNVAATAAEGLYTIEKGNSLGVANKE